MTSNDGSHRPTATLDSLRLRAKLLGAARELFSAHGYLEVETPVLSHDVVVDAHLEPFAVNCREGSPPCVMFLQTSPEFGMKRLLAAGARSIYQVTRAFRKGELGRLHNPEFTMIEWYRVGDTHHEQMDFVELLVNAVFDSARENGGSVTSLPRPFERMSYNEAFQRALGRPVLDLSGRELLEIAREAGIVAPDSLTVDDRDGWLNLLLAERVEPRLGRDCPTFLYDYPASQAALAKVRPGNPPVAERFELYIRGIEICNGYHELTDAAELRRRMKTQAELRSRDGHRALPNENRLLAAMDAGLPDCAGVALGFDRLVMLAAGANSLAEVTAFPFDRA